VAYWDNEGQQEFFKSNPHCPTEKDHNTTASTPSATSLQKKIANKYIGHKNMNESEVIK
jgi:hypothetical protein